MIVLWLLFACGPREVPPHLRVDPAPVAGTIQAPADLPSALSLLLGADPLARRPDPSAPLSWGELDGGEPLVAWATLAIQSQPSPTSWAGLEAAQAGTMAVGLARGARLAKVESLLAAGEGLPIEEEAATWLAPLRSDAAIDPARTRGPLAWLGGPPEERKDRALHLSERAVMLGWLDGPSVPAEPVVEAFRGGLAGQLLESPAGALLQARASGRKDQEAGEQGRIALQEATFMALQAASADRDVEQAAWAAERKRKQQELQTPDPIAFLLARARELLTRDGGQSGSAGLALVAMTAERLYGTCPDAPCGGLDRAATLARLEAWGPEVAPPARTWRVVALKRATDGFEVAHERPSFPIVAIDLADALLGAGAGSIDAALLGERTAGPSACLALSRATGLAMATDPTATLDALKARLTALSESALEVPQPPDQSLLLSRIHDRAGR